jgi:hypothetical protein
MESQQEKSMILFPFQHLEGSAARHRLVTLLDIMSQEPLDPTFEKYGNFNSGHPMHSRSVGYGPDGRMQYEDTDSMYPHHPGMIRFFGNFMNYSFGFTIDTDEPEVIAQLNAAIQANKETEAYKAIKIEAEKREAVRLGRRTRRKA